MQDLRDHGVTMLTIGQYLQPSKDHLAVERYVHPDDFAMFEREARKWALNTLLVVLLFVQVIMLTNKLQVKKLNNFSLFLT